MQAFLFSLFLPRPATDSFAAVSQKQGRLTDFSLDGEARPLEALEPSAYFLGAIGKLAGKRGTAEMV